MIDGEFYRDDTVPSDEKALFPERLVALGYKVKADVIKLAESVSDLEEAVQKVRRYLSENRLRLIEPLQISLIAGERLLYHDWERLPGYNPRRKLRGAYRRIYNGALNHRSGICTWDDSDINDPAVGRRRRKNLGVFESCRGHEVVVLVEIHWGDGFDQFLHQIEHTQSQIRPLRVEFVDTTELLIHQLVRKPEELHLLTAAQFEDLVENRFRAMGFDTVRTGHTYARDGGVDLLFWPTRAAFPFLGAAQIKHHRRDRKTGVATVREFGSVLETNPISTGFIVTNTSFTPDAKWVAGRMRLPVRLRDNRDLQRWIDGRFVAEEEWREMPTEIELGPGLKIAITGGRA